MNITTRKTRNDKSSIVENVETLNEATEVNQDNSDDLVPNLELVQSYIQELELDDLKMILENTQSRIEEIENQEIEELDRQIAELMAKRNSLKSVEPIIERVESVKKRDIIPIYNPKNPNEFYTVGKRPKWLDEMLKESLGDKFGDAQLERTLIIKWRGEQ